ncbi:MAG: NAD-binding protein, partial [Anaerolineae bacterium]
MTLPPTIVVWGAGRIGRGFVADLFAGAGYHVVFVDRAEALVDTLRRRGRYTVVRTDGRERHDQAIDGFEVWSTAQT